MWNILSNFAASSKNFENMRFYKQVWGIIWEFNSIWEYVSFCIGRVIGAAIFFGFFYLALKYGWI